MGLNIITLGENAIMRKATAGMTEEEALKGALKRWPGNKPPKMTTGALLMATVNSEHHVNITSEIRNESNGISKQQVEPASVPSTVKPSEGKGGGE